MNIIIIGGGLKTYFLAKKFISIGYSVTIINKKREEALQLAKMEKVTVVNGDATLPEILEDAGAYMSNVIISLTSSDPDNLVICQIAKKIFKVKKTVAIVNDPGNIEVFKSLGINTVVSTVNIITSLVKHSVGFDTIMNITPVEKGKVMILEIDVEENDPICNKSLTHFEIPHDAIIGCIIRNELPIIPRGDTEVLSGDRLIIMTLPQSQSATLKSIKKRVD